MKKPILLIAPGLSLFLVGALILLALTGFHPLPGASEVRVASAGPPVPPALAAITSSAPPELTPSVVAVASGLPEVRGVAEIKSGTRWLTAWSADDSPAPIEPPPGHRVPVDIAAVEPEHFRNLVPEPLQDTISELANGGAVLSRTGAALRGIEANGVIHLEGRSIPVIGVVENDILRDHEIVVSNATGAGIGLNRTRYLIIGLHDLTSGGHVEQAVRAALPPGASLTIRGPSGSGASALPSPLLSIGRIKEIFGEFPAIAGAATDITIDQAWIDAHTEIATIPRLGEFRCHKKMIPQMRLAFEEVERAGLGDLIRPGDSGGCFSPRFIRSGNDAGLSRHAWGIAFDFNVSSNLYGAIPSMDLRLVEIMERHGFSWGGHWRYPDGMHFEFVHEFP